VIVKSGIEGDVQNGGVLNPEMVGSLFQPQTLGILF
jgi:hypothetical protein